MGKRGFAGSGIVAVVAACSSVLVACESAQDPGSGVPVTSSPAREELVCPENTEDVQFDYDMSDPSFRHTTAEEAILLDAVGGGRLPAGRDVEVAPTRWYRLDDSGQVVVEFRVGRTPDGDYYLDGYTRCSDS